MLHRRRGAKSRRKHPARSVVDSVELCNLGFCHRSISPAGEALFFIGVESRPGNAFFCGGPGMPANSKRRPAKAAGWRKL